MRLFLTGLCCAMYMAAAAQTHTYLFSNFNEAGSGPALSEVLACGAPPGSFGTGIINTSTGICGTGPRPVFNFAQGAGVQYPNGSITGTYTLHLFFSFASNNNYRRLVDFQNGQTDAGLYILSGSLNFYPNGNVGPANSFNTNTYYLLTLVRDGPTNQISIYLDGTAFGTYSDAAGTYATATTAIPIVLFRDDIASSAQCEASAGSVKYFSIRPTTSTASEVAAVYADICNIALPVRLLSFGVDSRGSEHRLRWQSGSESALKGYAVEHSSDGSQWRQIGFVPATAAGSYSYTDAQQPGIHYYRLRLLDLDGSFAYSETLRVIDGEKTGAAVLLEANPARGSISLQLPDPVGVSSIRLLDPSGKCVWETRRTEARIQIPTGASASGLYIIQCRTLKGTEYQKVLVNP